MTEWRALTQGGCLPGSQTFTDAGTFTTPSGVTRIKVRTYIAGSYEYTYIDVVPGTKYAVGYYSGKYVTQWTFNGVHCGGQDSDSMTIYWSNSINQGGS